MNSALAFCVVAAFASGTGSQMDRSIAGRTLDSFQDSAYDARQKLYLFYGGD